MSVIYATHNRLKILLQRSLKTVAPFELLPDRIRFNEYEMSIFKKGSNKNYYRLYIPEIELSSNIWLVNINPELYELGQISGSNVLVPGKVEPTFYLNPYSQDVSKKDYLFDLFLLTI